MEHIKVKAVRANLDMTQEDMARYLGISGTAYILKEQGKRDFTWKEVYKICKLANIENPLMLDIPTD